MDRIANRIEQWEAPERNWVVRQVARGCYVTATALLVLGGAAYHVVAATFKAPCVAVRLLTFGFLAKRYTFAALMQQHVRPFLRCPEATLKLLPQFFVCNSYAQALRQSNDYILPGGKQRAPASASRLPQTPEHVVEPVVVAPTASPQGEGSWFVRYPAAKWIIGTAAATAAGVALYLLRKQALCQEKMSRAIEGVRQQCFDKDAYEKAQHRVFVPTKDGGECYYWDGDVIPPLAATECPLPLTASIGPRPSSLPVMSIERPRSFGDLEWSQCVSALSAACQSPHQLESSTLKASCKTGSIQSVKFGFDRFGFAC